MKVLLINPPTSFEQIYGDWDLSLLDTYTPPLGILHIASYLRQYDHEVNIMDLQVPVSNFESAVNEILSYKPDVVGLSAMTINCLNAKRIAKELRKNGFLSPIVLGGSHISAVPIETFEKFTDVDYGVIGEGEVTFFELVEKIDKNQPVDDVKGIIWRNKNGQIIINEARPPIGNLDTLPLPAWDLLSNFPESYPSSLLESKRLPAAAIMTSRGCPFQCTFCDHRVFGSRVRHFSAEYTLRMIRHLKLNYGIKDLMILDDNFLIDEDKLFEICNAMIEEKMDLTWYCIGHAKSMTEDRLLKIKKAGCWFIELGIESGNDQILKQIKKKISKAEVSAVAKAAKKVGLRVKGNFIFGFPGETPETLAETTKFAKDLDIDFLQQNFLTIWPGCEISDEISLQPDRSSYFENDWGKLAHQRVTFIPAGLTKERLIEASKHAFRRFYLRPRIILGLLPLLFSLRGIKFGFTAFRVFFKTIFRKESIP